MKQMPIKSHIRQIALLFVDIFCDLGGSCVDNRMKIIWQGGMFKNVWHCSQISRKLKIYEKFFKSNWCCIDVRHGKSSYPLPTKITGKHLYANVIPLS